MRVEIELEWVEPLVPGAIDYHSLPRKKKKVMKKKIEETIIKAATVYAEKILRENGESET